jgi:hypothetical protein
MFCPEHRTKTRSAPGKLEHVVFWEQQEDGARQVGRILSLLVPRAKSRILAVTGRPWELQRDLKAGKNHISFML